MADTPTKVPVKSDPKETAPSPKATEWWPMEGLRREVDRLFEEFDRGFGRGLFGRSLLDTPRWGAALNLAAAPSVDIVEKDKAYEVTAELPGMDESNIDVKLANGMLTITGEKKEEHEEKKKNYHLSERRYGSFQRSFRVPDGVDADKVAAAFKNGVLTVTLPKSADALKAEKKITIKPG
ncbi:MAG: Hsp20/alpha crystallin family protein [Alphaproteobacteria bacterium]|nr:Hsp20/alpha crystallin family protein [Alphaproteobacteria bacterium]